jgi:hypothetical protein
MDCLFSIGGVWIQPALPIEMSFLDISVLHDTPRAVLAEPSDEYATFYGYRLSEYTVWASGKQPEL